MFLVPTKLGSNYVLVVYVLNFRMVASEMLFLSNPFSLSRNPISIINCLMLDHSVFSPRSTNTASMTICTAAGGLEKPLIYVMSFLLSLLRASAAASRAGVALFSYVLA